MTWQVGLATLASALDRDLQAAARRAGGPLALWNAGGERLRSVLGGSDAAVATWVGERARFHPAAAQAALQAMGGWWVGLGAQRMPRRLAELADPPFALFGRGRPLDEMERAPWVGIVGSRRPTAHGSLIARALARGLAERGAVIVSGLALGIDAEAHAGALAASGPTIAVLGSSLDHVAPRRNQDLAERIVLAGGVLVTEYWLGTAPAPWRFPARNRIVAGLSDVVVVVEAAERSGALITADFALELGRTVMAVPGRAGGALSAGCHDLLRAGAGLCESADDVIRELPGAGWTSTPARAERRLDGMAASIASLLGRAPMTVDDLSGALGVPTASLLQVLGTLEVEGVLARVDGQRYAVTPP